MGKRLEDEGFYWVKIPGVPDEWKVGQYFRRSDSWQVTGDSVSLRHDEDMTEIGDFIGMSPGETSEPEYKTSKVFHVILTFESSRNGMSEVSHEFHDTIRLVEESIEKHRLDSRHSSIKLSDYVVLEQVKVDV
jgi:hypothetical protein